MIAMFSTFDIIEYVVEVVHKVSTPFGIDRLVLVAELRDGADLVARGRAKYFKQPFLFLGRH
jgi:hypothetical protein